MEKKRLLDDNSQYYKKVLKHLAGKTVTHHDLDKYAQELGMDGYRLWDILDDLVNDMYISGNNEKGIYRIPLNAHLEVRDTNNGKTYLRLEKRKNEYGEYLVKAYKEGKLNEEGTYYTDDWEDAVNTFYDCVRRLGYDIIKDEDKVKVAIKKEDVDVKDEDTPFMLTDEMFDVLKEDIYKEIKKRKDKITFEFLDEDYAYSDELESELEEYDNESGEVILEYLAKADSQNSNRELNAIIHLYTNFEDNSTFDTLEGSLIKDIDYALENPKIRKIYERYEDSKDYQVVIIADDDLSTAGSKTIEGAAFELPIELCEKDKLIEIAKKYQRGRFDDEYQYLVRDFTTDEYTDYDFDWDNKVVSFYDDDYNVVDTFKFDKYISLQNFTIHDAYTRKSLELKDPKSDISKYLAKVSSSQIGKKLSIEGSEERVNEAYNSLIESGLVEIPNEIKTVATEANYEEEVEHTKSELEDAKPYGLMCWELEEFMREISNNEELYYGTQWLSECYPDGDSKKEVIDEFNTKEDYDNWRENAKSIYKFGRLSDMGKNPRDPEGIYELGGYLLAKYCSPRTIEIAHEFDKELGFDPIEVK